MIQVRVIRTFLIEEIIMNKGRQEFYIEIELEFK